MHPRWGSHVYPATLFAVAPLPLLEQAFRDAAAAQAAASGSGSAVGASAAAVDAAGGEK